jgi:hypothetical protein
MRYTALEDVRVMDTTTRLELQENKVAQPQNTAIIVQYRAMPAGCFVLRFYKDS